MELLLAVAFIASILISQPANCAPEHSPKFGILAQLARLSFDPSDLRQTKCSLFEQHLRDTYKNVVLDSSREQVFNLALQEAPATGLTEDEARVAAELRKCMTAPTNDHDQEAKSVNNAQAHSMSNAEATNAQAPLQSAKRPQINFVGIDLVKLSRVQYDSKALPLGQRCQAFEDTLRDIFGDEPFSKADRRELFANVIDALAARRVPFRKEQPLLEPLKECLQEPTEITLSEPKRTVIAGPNYPKNELFKKIDPIENMKNEFKKVKENVVDFGQDLYAPNKDKSDTYENDYHQDKHQTSADLPHFELEDNKPKMMDRALMKKYVEEEELDEMIESERDPLKKLELELEREKQLTTSLRIQMDKNRYEIEDLEAEVKNLQSTVKAQRAAKLLINEELKNLEAQDDQVREREARTKLELQQVTKRLQEMEETRLFNGQNLHLNDANNRGDDTDENDDNKDKVYEGPEKIAEKLQDKLNSSESPNNKCQKYFLALNYPGKVTKRVVKTIAKLRLPENSISNNSEFYESLEHFANILSQEKDSLAARELKECLPSSFSRMKSSSRYSSSIERMEDSYEDEAYHSFSRRRADHRRPTAQEVPVEIVGKSNHMGGSWTFSGPDGVGSMSTANVGGVASGFVQPSLRYSPRTYSYTTHMY